VGLEVADIDWLSESFNPAIYFESISKGFLFYPKLSVC
jgi:hypothetical protein